MSERVIKPAIVAVGYNRPDSLKRLLRSIESADYPVDDIDLIVSIDKSSNQEDVVRAANEVEWSHGRKVVRAFDERQGLRRHIIQCGDLSQKYGAVIILEDDLVVSPSYYHYTLSAINRYYHDDNICGVALYRHSWNEHAHLPFTPTQNEYDAFCGQFSITWGQCWSDKQWSGFKKWYLENENRFPRESEYLPANILRWSNQSWGKYFISYIVEKDKYYIIPYTAMSTNFTEVGQHHAAADTSYQVPLMIGIKTKYSLPSFDDSIKYDVFFERIFAKDTLIAGISTNDICINLNGIKPTSLGKKYVISTQIAHAKALASFGILMRPIEENIVMNTTGNDIFLYDISTVEMRVNIKKPGIARTRYELYDFYWGTLLDEGFRRCRSAIAQKARRLLGKK